MTSIAVSIPINEWTPQLKAVLGSLKAQEQFLELAVLVTRDDPKILSELEQSELDFAYKRVGKDLGQADAIAEGWQNTDSPLITWLNADDALTGNAAALAVNAFKENPDLDMFYGHSTISNQENNVIGLHPAVVPIGPLLLRTNIISQPSCFLKRTAVEKIGGLDKSLHYTMDWDLWLRLYSDEALIACTEKILSNVTWASGTKTASFSRRRASEVYEILRRSQSRLKTLVGLYSMYREHKSTYKSSRTKIPVCRPIIANRNDKFIPVINMHGEQKNKIDIYLDNQGSGFTSPDRQHRQVKSPSMSSLIFDKPVRPGETVLIECDNGEDAATTISEIRFSGH